MDLELVVLGSNSALPLVNRNPTSQFLTLANRHFLIDCGEGTQVQLRKCRIGFGRINHIFISHLHGDHIFGLAPLLCSMHMLDRAKKVHIYGPPNLKELMDYQLRMSNTWLKYPVVYHVLEKGGKQLVFEDNKVTVSSFPLDHSLDCWGFLFEEKPRPLNIKKEALAKYRIPVAEIRAVKTGADWVDENGRVIPNSELTYKAGAPLSYAFCTDTAPVGHLKDYIADVDLLYHEATFTEEHAQRALETKHTTALQAGQIAKMVNAKRLLIGHFSTRYDDLTGLLAEAKSTFDKTYLAREGIKYVLKSKLEELINEPILY